MHILLVYWIDEKAELVGMFMGRQDYVGNASPSLIAGTSRKSGRARNEREGDEEGEADVERVGGRRRRMRNVKKEGEGEDGKGGV